MEFKIFDLGLVDFLHAWDFQKEIFCRVKNCQFPAALIICQHYPVITLGRGADRKNILADERELKKRNIPVYEIERGGDVTYHGPGQLVVYPIYNLSFFQRDIHLFLRKLEEMAITVLEEFGISPQRLPGLTGVWVGEKKIASIGIAIKNWITFHGLAINIKQDDLANFSLVRPCGLDITMTSLETVLNKPVNLNSVRDTLRANQGTPFQLIGRLSPANRR